MRKPRLRTVTGLELESELQGAFAMRDEVLGTGSHSRRAREMRRKEKEASLWVPGLVPQTSSILLIF